MDHVADELATATESKPRPFVTDNLTFGPFKVRYKTVNNSRIKKEIKNRQQHIGQTMIQRKVDKFQDLGFSRSKVKTKKKIVKTNTEKWPIVYNFVKKTNAAKYL